MKSKRKAVALIAAASIGLSPAQAQEASEPVQSQLQSEDRAYSIFILVKTTPAWLALSPPERFAFLGEEVQPILAAHPDVTMRFWDTEHFNARVTDVVLFETQNLRSYSMVIEKLRETRFWGPYFDVVEVLPGIENAYADAYDVEPY